MVQCSSVIWWIILLASLRTATAAAQVAPAGTLPGPASEGGAHGSLEVNSSSEVEVQDAMLRLHQIAERKREIKRLTRPKHYALKLVLSIGVAAAGGLGILGGLALMPFGSGDERPGLIMMAASAGVVLVGLAGLACVLIRIENRRIAFLRELDELEAEKHFLKQRYQSVRSRYEGARPKLALALGTHGALLNLRF